MANTQLGSLELFPLTVLNTEYKNNLNSLIDRLYNLQKSNPTGVALSNIGGYQTQPILHKDPNFFPFINFIQTLTLQHINKQSKFDAMWGNISGKYHYNQVHTHHNNSDEGISGVLYLKTPPNSGNIVFHSYSNPSKIHPIEPYVGLVLLFPIDAPHSVVHNLSEDDRITLAFNLSFY